MNWLGTKRGLRTATEHAERLLDDWRLVVSARGCLTLQPLRAYLTYHDIRRVCERVRPAVDAGTFKDLVLDFALVEGIAAPWTPVFALIVELGRRVNGRCRVIALHGQPAGVAELLLGGCHLGTLSFEYQRNGGADLAQTSPTAA